jgi:hypothetical protein
VEPWFDPRFSWAPGLLFGVAGAATSIIAGKLAPLGKARRGVLGSLYAQLVISALLLCIAAYARSAGQPFMIWGPGIALPGLINSVVLSITTIKTIRIYREAGERRLAAQAGM